MEKDRMEKHPEIRSVDPDILAQNNNLQLVSTSMSGEAEENFFYYDLPSYYRWFAVISFTIMSVIMGPAYMNWPPLYDMFSWANAYSHLCNDPTDSSYKLKDHGEIFCDDKHLAISAIFPAAIGTRFAFDLVGGALLDCFGGKITTLFGLTFQIIGWVLIGLSGASFNGYMPGIVMVAAGSDPSYFGIISVANLFPGWNSTIMSTLGAARSVAFANGLVMREIWKQQEATSMRGIALTFAVILFLCFLFTVFCVPLQQYPKLPPGVSLNTQDGEGKIGYKEILGRKPRIDLQRFVVEANVQIKGVLKYALTMPYLAFCFIPVASFIRQSYYGVSFKEHLPIAKNFHTIITPLSMLPCPLLGILADRFSTVLALVVVAVCGALSMLLVIFSGVALKYISTILNFVFISFVTSQFYVYVGYNYPQQQMGKLVGLALLIGGLTSLAATPMFNFSTETNNFLPMDLLVVILEVIVVLICVYLQIKVEAPLRRDAKARKAAVVSDGVKEV